MMRNRENMKKGEIKSYFLCALSLSLPKGDYILPNFSSYFSSLISNHHDNEGEIRNDMKRFICFSKERKKLKAYKNQLKVNVF
jgi:hypothetical protein